MILGLTIICFSAQAEFKIEYPTSYIQGQTEINKQIRHLGNQMEKRRERKRLKLEVEKENIYKYEMKIAAKKALESNDPKEISLFIMNYPEYSDLILKAYKLQNDK